MTTAKIKSIRNKLNEPIRNVEVLVVFKDQTIKSSIDLIFPFSNVADGKGREKVFVILKEVQPGFDILPNNLFKLKNRNMTFNHNTELKGKKTKLIKMADPYTDLVAGDMGIVDFVEDADQT